MSCLGADTVVELVEGRADDATWESALAHASTCTACRGLLSNLARDDTRASAEALGATIAAPPSVSGSPTLNDRPARPSKQEVGATIDRYRVVRLLGAGGMGYVYAARDPELDRMVALKLLRPDVGGPEAQLRMQERLRREAQAMAQLAHPHVVAVHDVGVFEDRVFVAMEYIEGGTLATWVDGRTAKEILDAYIAAGRGLAAAHAAGLVHRDFKPDNVLVGGDGRVRVGDFGLARTLDNKAVPRSPTSLPPSAELSHTGVVMGTPLYMAPEQFVGDPADARSDQFSFCVSLHGAIYGDRPFAGDTFGQLADSVLSHRIVEPAKRVRLPRRAKDAIRRGMALSPADRWPTMDALLAELAAPPPRWPWIVAGAAAAGIATAGIAVFAMDGEPSRVHDCDHPMYEASWNDARKAEITGALTKLPFAAATAREAVAIGDRYVASLQAMHAGACKAFDRNEIHSDVRQAEYTCVLLHRYDLDALTEKLAHPDVRVATRAVAAMSSLPTVADCTSRETRQLLVPPHANEARQAINAIIRKVSPIRAARWLADDAAMPFVTDMVARLATTEEPAVRAEVLVEAGLYAAEVADFAHARDWLARAAADGELGRHDVAQARALVGSILVVGRDLQGDVAAIRGAAELAVRRLKDRPELELARLVAEGTVARDRAQLETAVALADKILPDDLQRLAVRRALAGVLPPDEAKPVLELVLGRQTEILGGDHPVLVDTLVALGDLAGNDVASAFQIYQRARAIAERAGARPEHAEALAHLAALHVLRGNLDAGIKLYHQAIDLDGTSHAPHAIAHASALAAVYTKMRMTAEANAIYARVLAAQRASLPADDPRIAATEAAMRP